MLARVLTVVCVLSLVSSVGLGTLEAFGLWKGQSHETLLREGTTLLAQGNWAEAAGRLRHAVASENDTVRLMAHHNLGLAFLHLAREGKGGEARRWVTAAIHNQEWALEIQPGLLPAAWNLELALERLRALEKMEESPEKEASQRLLASFRLQEEEALGEGLKDRINRSGPLTPPGPGRGPQW